MAPNVFRRTFAVAAAVALFVACGSTDTSPVVYDPTPDAGASAKDGASEEEIDSGGEAIVDGATDTGALVWPTCDAKPSLLSPSTIAAIWQANPATETETWISGAYVTGISSSRCSAGKACQIFLQSDLSYPSLGAAAKHGIKMFVSGAVASRFTNVAVGDRVDVLGWAWRYTLGGQNELLLEVNAKLPGCAKTKSTGAALVPISGVALSDLTLDVYESSHGPLFVRVASVSGKPDASPTSTFGLYPTTDSGFFDAGADAGANIVSLSPYFLPSSTFVGLSAGNVTRFSSITGVFGLFAPAAGGKYLEIYARAMTDIVVQ